MKKARLCLLVLVFAACPATAHAWSDWWEWLEALSGPEFSGWGVEGRLLCLPREAAGPLCFSDKDERIRHVVVFGGGWYSTGDKPLFLDTPDDRREVRLVKIDGTYMYRFHRMLDVGVGAGVMSFSGTGLDRFSVVTLTPLSLSFTPLAFIQPQRAWPRKLVRVLRLRFTETYLSRITGADFGSTSRYLGGGEFIGSFRIALDFGSLIGP